jgi:predicted anti-sigma-YlaC factor YlaD
VDKLSCAEVLEQLADYLDQDARAELCRQIEAHLTGCHDCQLYVDTVKKTIVLYQADREIKMPVHLTDRLRTAMEQEYQRDQAARRARGPGDAGARD